VARFGLQEGDTVGVGQEVARLDTRDLTLAADAARADRDLAAANLRLLVAGARAEEIAEAEANVARQVADLHSAESDLGRVEGLVEAGSGTDKARDDARARRDMSAGALRAAEERLKRFRAGSRPEELDAARARLAAAEARAAGAASQLADAVTASPVAGVLTAKLVEAGEWVMPGAVIAVVTDLAHPWLNVFLGETDLGRIRIGQTVEVATDDGQMRTGRVSYIASSAEFTPRNVQTREERVKLVYRVKIAMDNADGLFKPGMPAEARLTVAPRAGRS
jgi:HlyD family secretion protein